MLGGSWNDEIKSKIAGLAREFSFASFCALLLLLKCLCVGCPPTACGLARAFLSGASSYIPGKIPPLLGGSCCRLRCLGIGDGGAADRTGVCSVETWESGCECEVRLVRVPYQVLDLVPGTRYFQNYLYPY